MLIIMKLFLILYPNICIKRHFFSMYVGEMKARQLNFTSRILAKRNNVSSTFINTLQRCQQ